MTIIYGYNLNNTVVLAADRRRAVFNHDGQIIGIETDEAKKVIFLSNNAIMTSAGAGIGTPIKDLLQSILRGKEGQVPVNELIGCAKEVLKTNWGIMNSYIPTASKILPLRVWIGVVFMGEGFLFSMGSSDNFEEVIPTEGVGIWGPDRENQERATLEFRKYTSPPIEPQEILSVFSEINREVAIHTQLISPTMNAIVLRQEGLLPLLVSSTGELSQYSL